MNGGDSVGMMILQTSPTFGRFNARMQCPRSIRARVGGRMKMISCVSIENVKVRAVRILSAVCVVSSVGFAARGGTRLLAAALVATAAAVGIQSLVDCGDNIQKCTSLGLEERVQRLESEVKESASLLRGMSRQLEKLSIRFRLTRRALKPPIQQTIENSEATRALTAQQQCLQSEVSELQSALLAMHDQQRKQLDLILAVAKTAQTLSSS